MFFVSFRFVNKVAVQPMEENNLTTASATTTIKTAATAATTTISSTTATSNVKYSVQNEKSMENGNKSQIQTPPPSEVAKKDSLDFAGT
jgi:hypothetical protein